MYIDSSDSDDDGDIKNADRKQRNRKRKRKDTDKSDEKLEQVHGRKRQIHKVSTYVGFYYFIFL